MANDNTIKISVDIVDKAAEAALKNLVGKGAEAEKGLKKVGDTGSSSFNEIAVSIGKATGIYDIFVGNLAANLATKAIEILTDSAKKLFQVFVVDGVKAAQEQEVANHKLNIALAQTGIYSEKTAKNLQEYASELQKVTGESDDVITTNMALIQSLAQLDADGLKRATKAALDFAAVTGKDVGTASEALAKAANGNVTAFQKLGITIQKGQTNAETFNNALKQLEGRFGGAAASKVNTYAGSLAFATGQFGELQEEIGNLVVKNNAFIEVYKTIGNMFAKAVEHIQNNTHAYKELVAEGLILVIRSLALMTTTFDAVGRVGTATFQALLTPVYALGYGIAKVMAFANKDFEKAAQNIEKMWDQAATSVVDAFTEDTALGAVTTALLELEQAAGKGLSKLESGASTTVAPLNQVAVKTRELTAEQKKYNDELERWLRSLAKTDTDAEAMLGRRLESLKFELDNKLITEQEYLTAKADAENAALEMEQARIDEANAKKVGSHELRLAAQTALDEKYEQLRVKRKAEADARERELDQKKFNAVKDTFGNLSSLMQTQSRELFAIGKAAAIASASINTYEAITKTMASVPYPFNIPLAIAQGIAGAVQVANIAATQPRFEQGGIVPGNSFSGDKVSARVNSGEMILNKSQQRELFKVANGNGGSPMGEIAELLRALLVKDESVIVNIGGKTVVDTLRSELNSGRAFA